MTDAPDTRDPYDPPRSAVPDPPNASPPARLPSWAIVLAVGPALLVALGILAIVPQFADVFRNFGAELPLPTRLLAGAPYAGFAWPLLIGGLAATWRTERRRMAPLVVLSLVGGLLLILLVVGLMYWPIFQLAATV